LRGNIFFSILLGSYRHVLIGPFQQLLGDVVIEAVVDVLASLGAINKENSQNKQSGLEGEKKVD
jgi:hypothetical protein